MFMPLYLSTFDFFDSMPSKASESSYNRPFTHFDEAEAKFRRLAFDQSLKESLSNPNYKPQLQQSINEVFKFQNLVVDEIQKENGIFP